MLAELHFGPAGNIDGGLGEQILREFHHVAKIGVSLVELEHGEFGIPAPAQALVAEVAIDFINAIEPAHG